MSIMDRIDRLMLIVARIALGVLLLESVLPNFVGWMNPFLDHRGLPYVYAPFFQVVLFIVCLWYLPLIVCRIILAIGAGVLLMLCVVASLFLLTHLDAMSVKFREYLSLDLFIESLYCFGFFSLLWVSFRPPARRHTLPKNFLSLHHARA
jgi:hypothetical protein